MGWFERREVETSNCDVRLKNAANAGHMDLGVEVVSLGMDT